MRVTLYSGIKTTTKRTILIADDEADVLALLSSNLRSAGFDVAEASDGETALAKARSEQPVLLILDVMMPELSGLELCKVLKRDPSTQNIPIILLTAKAGEIDRVLGFELGADDYVTKPFSPRELVLRVQSILRRSQEPAAKLSQVQIGRILMDMDRHQTFVDQRPVDLTAIEFKLLQMLMMQAGRVLTRSSLLTEIWGFDRVVETRTIDTHMRRLREKLGPAADQIQTVRSFGYRLEAGTRFQATPLSSQSTI